MKRLFAALVVTLLAAPAQAADPVKVIVPFAAGGPVDALARILAAELGPRLQTDVVVENLGGAGGLLAVDRAASAAPDGRTILFASVGAFVITNALKPKPGYDQLKTFAPVARVGAAPTAGGRVAGSRCGSGRARVAGWPAESVPRWFSTARSAPAARPARRVCGRPGWTGA